MSSRPLNRPDKHGETVVKRSSRRHESEEHSSAWKVAFADFCLALMCLFLVMWVMAARQQELIQEVMRAPGGQVMDEGQGILPESMGGPRGSLLAREPVPRRGDTSDTGRGSDASASADEPVREPFSAKARYESPSELYALSQKLVRLSESAGLGGNLQSVVTPYGLRVLMHDTDQQGMFERGSAVANRRFRQLLRDMGPLFASMDNQMLVVGHTDSLQYADQSHSAFSNWTLSSNRAMAARSQLLAGGMPTRSVLQVVGMADRAPLNREDASAGVNRRIELVILTSEQARVVSSMFGMPTTLQPLMQGADTTVPDSEALQTLRAQMNSNERVNDASQSAR